MSSAISDAWRSTCKEWKSSGKPIAEWQKDFKNSLKSHGAFKKLAADHNLTTDDVFAAIVLKLDASGQGLREKGGPHEKEVLALLQLGQSDASRQGQKQIP